MDRLQDPGLRSCVLPEGNLDRDSASDTVARRNGHQKGTLFLMPPSATACARFRKAEVSRCRKKRFDGGLCRLIAMNQWSPHEHHRSAKKPGCRGTSWTTKTERRAGAVLLLCY